MERKVTISNPAQHCLGFLPKFSFNKPKQHKTKDFFSVFTIDSPSLSQ